MVAYTDDDDTPVSFPTLLPRDFTAHPISPTCPPSPLLASDASSDASEDDDDYSPPHTPVLLPPLLLHPLPRHCFNPKHERAEHVSRDIKSVTAPLVDGLFAADTHRASRVDFTHTAAVDSSCTPDDVFDHDTYFAPHPHHQPAYHLTLLNTTVTIADAYLHPTVASPLGPLVVYDPAWHADADPRLALPRVYVVGPDDELSRAYDDDDVQQWHDTTSTDDDDVHLTVPMKMPTGRLSAEDESYFHSLRVDEEEEEGEDAFGRTRRVDEDGLPTCVPVRVPGRRWLWKNF